MSKLNEKDLVQNQEEIINIIDEDEKDEKLLQKKRDKNSNEKEVILCEQNDDVEKIQTKKNFDSIEDFSLYLLTLKNPYAIIGNEKINLLTEEGQSKFYYDKKIKKIYQKKDENNKIYNNYKFYLSEYEETKTRNIKVNYPIELSKLYVGSNFFLNIHIKNCPKLYSAVDDQVMGLLLFFFNVNSNIYYLFNRKNTGSTLYFMKQMSRRNEYYIYFDLQKLNSILCLKESNQNKYYNKLKKFIYYSLFNIHAPMYNLEERFKDIEKYYNFIFKKIYNYIYTNDNNNNIIKNIFDAYIDLYKTFIYQILLKEKRRYCSQLLIIIDHYNSEIEYDHINKIFNEKENEHCYLKILIQHSLSDKRKINEFFKYLNDNNFNLWENSDNGIAFIKDKIIFGYFDEMYEFDKENLDNIKILKLYKNELLENFGLNNPYYIYKFIDYMESQNQEEKNQKIFDNFLNMISNQIELDIKNFYNNDLSLEYFYISKYYNIFIDKNEKFDNNKIDYIKNLPLDYFNIKFIQKTKDIVNIIPSFNLINNIILKKSKNFSSIIYQSDFYDKIENYGEKGNILQKVIKDKIRYDSSVLLNPTEKNIIFEIEYLIPSAKIINNKKYDPVNNYYKAILGLKGNQESDIIKYMTEKEIIDMENLSKKFKEMNNINNIILLEKDPNAKNYDLCIIKLLEEKKFIVIACQITTSKDNDKYKNINTILEYDILYINDKFENYLSEYKSAGFYLLYMVDKDDIHDLLNNNININFKNGLNNNLSEQVHLLYFSRKYLNFYTTEGKIVKDICYKNEKIEFITSDINHYFSDENTINIFNKIIKLFLIKVGKIYIDYYDGYNEAGNFMIFIKISDNNFIITININGKKIHILEAKNGKIKQIYNEINYDKKLSYFFEIINSDEINTISLFSEINY